MKKSINAVRVVAKLKEDISKGKIANISKTMRDVGYSDYSARAVTVKDTRAYKENMPNIIDGLQEEITQIKNAMAGKDKSNEEYRVLVYALDNLTKNYQLLSGGATERQVFVMPSEILEKNTIENVELLPDNDVKQLKDGST